MWRSFASLCVVRDLLQAVYEATGQLHLSCCHLLPGVLAPNAGSTCGDPWWSTSARRARPPRLSPSASWWVWPCQQPGAHWGSVLESGVAGAGEGVSCPRWILPTSSSPGGLVPCRW